MRIIWIVAAAASIVTSACGRSATETAEGQSAASTGAEIEAPNTQTEAEKLAAENLATSNAFLAANAELEGVTVTDSGLQYMVLEEGPETGVTPVSTDLVQFEYVSTKSDGVEFDSSRARGAAAQIKVRALGNEVPGLTEGLQLMSEGDRFRFFISPDLAYGKRGTVGGPVGPNEALIFDVELIKVQNPDTNLAASTAYLVENAKKDGITQTSSGLQYEVITEGPGDGKSPTAENTVKVHYAGTLMNGTEFDSSYARGEPIEFPLGGVIAGWTEGLQLMSVGDKYRLFIPPALAYGADGGGPIGPNEALIFEVELIDVK